MFALLYPILLILCLQAGPLWPWLLLPFNILLVPAVDHGLKRLFPGLRTGKEFLSVVFADVWFGIYAIAQSAALLLAFLSLEQHHGSILAFLGLASGVGIMTGTGGITAAHELMHRRQSWARASAQLLLSSCSYLHFTTMHTRCHHRHAATPDDPSTARLGESFPAYFARVMQASYRQAWSLEQERLDRRHLSPWHNRFLLALALQGLLLFVIVLSTGWLGLGFFILQSFIAVHLLEAVNYVQHYGLLRQGENDHSRPRVSTTHSWDSDYRFSELLIFNLSRHAEHHVDASKACHELSVAGDSPKLPYSFFLMVFLSLIPPLWHRLMDKEVARQGRSDTRPTSMKASTPAGPPNLLDAQS